MIERPSRDLILVCLDIEKTIWLWYTVVVFCFNFELDLHQVEVQGIFIE
jgi:hypothetical protein